MGRNTVKSLVKPTKGTLCQKGEDGQNTHGNNSKHTAKLTTQWLKEKKLMWSSQSQDLNRIENL